MTVMKIGSVYMNACAGVENPQRVGLFVGRSGKMCQFLHSDGSRSVNDNTDIYIEVNRLFSLGDIGQIAKIAEEQFSEEAKEISDRVWQKKFGRFGFGMPKNRSAGGTA